MKVVVEMDERAYNTMKKGFLVVGVQDGKPLDSVLDTIKAEIPKLACCENEYRQALVKVADVIKCIDKYKAESEVEKRKPCINYEDGCEEWAGCPCVHYKAESEEG